MTLYSKQATFKKKNQQLKSLRNPHEYLKSQQDTTHRHRLLRQASTVSTSHAVQNLSHAREKPHYESLKLLNAAQGDVCRIETHWGQGDGLQSLLYSRQTHSTQQQIFNSVSLNPFTCSSFTAQKQSTHLKKARH